MKRAIMFVDDDGAPSCSLVTPISFMAAICNALQHTVRYTELSPTRFKNLWRD